MTQKSLVQEGHRILDGYVDSGPYAADQWAQLFYSTFCQSINLEGPVLPIGSLLCQTSGNDILIAAGNGWCGGRPLFNSAQVTITPQAPVVNPRIDRVCMVLNNTNTPLVVAPTQGTNLIFPTVLTDYEGTASIPAYSVRLAIVQGTEAAGPVAPTLDTTVTSVFMVPLYQYQLSTGGVFSGQVDQRTFCHSNFLINANNIPDDTIVNSMLVDETIQYDKIQNKQHRRWIHPTHVWNVTDGTLITPDTNAHTCWTFPDNKVVRAYGNYYVPDSAVDPQTLIMAALYWSASSGNIRNTWYFQWGEISTSVSHPYNEFTLTDGPSTDTSNGSNRISNAQYWFGSGDNLSPGHLIQFYWERDGTNVGDTINNSIHFLGFRPIPVLLY